MNHGVWYVDVKVVRYMPQIGKPPNGQVVIVDMDTREKTALIVRDSREGASRRIGNPRLTLRLSGEENMA